MARITDEATAARRHRDLGGAAIVGVVNRPLAAVVIERDPFSVGISSWPAIIPETSFASRFQLAELSQGVQT
jgi:hypothetical protein